MEFTIASIMKDAVLGAEMIGAKRLIIGKEDYEILMGEQARYPLDPDIPDTDRFHDTDLLIVFL